MFSLAERAEVFHNSHLLTLYFTAWKTSLEQERQCQQYRHQRVSSFLSKILNTWKSRKHREMERERWRERVKEGGSKGGGREGERKRERGGRREEESTLFYVCINTNACRYHLQTLKMQEARNGCHLLQYKTKGESRESEK